MHLVSLTVRSHPRLRPGTCLHFSSGKNILLGQNGTGKTTLLDLIACACSSDFSSYESVQYDLNYQLRIGGLLVDVSVANQRTHTLDRSREIPDSFGALKFEWRCRVGVTYKGFALGVVEYTPKGGQVSAAGGEPREADAMSPFERHSFIASALFELESSVTSDKKPEVISAAIEIATSSRNCYRFDEALNGFNKMVGRESTDNARFAIMKYVSENDTTTRYFPARAANVSWRIASKVAEEIAKWFKENPRDHMQLPSFYLYRRDLAFLSTACEIMAFQDSRMEVKALSRDDKGDSPTWDIAPWRFEFLEGQRAFTHDGLSFGQKRLLSLLYYVECSPGVVVADELVNGLHYHWIEGALDALSNSQSFLSSQNPLLLDHLEFGSADEVKSCFVICEKDQSPDRTSAEMCPRNLTDIEARLFYRKLQSDVQQVSEILEDMKLW